jgi:hypothetical protein
MNREKRDTRTRDGYELGKKRHASGMDMNWEKRDRCIRDGYELGKNRHRHQG